LLRQAGKTASFALQYSGTYKTLVQNCGFDEDEAKKLEAAYHELYKHSDQWNYKNLEQAASKGYVDLAYGLRLRTPILFQSILSSEKSLSQKAHKEIKTALNALIQSYSLLCTKALASFMERVWDSEYREQIVPAAQIHDALYFCIPNTLGALHWININLVQCMTDISGLPELGHDEIKLGANLELYWPNWAKSISFPNNASISELKQIVNQYLEKFNE
jgi:DNA polymerase-1